MSCHKSYRLIPDNFSMCHITIRYNKIRHQAELSSVQIRRYHEIMYVRTKSCSYALFHVIRTYLRTVEDRRFVHIIPGEEVHGTTYVLTQGELLSPPQPHLAPKNSTIVTIICIYERIRMEGVHDHLNQIFITHKN